MTYMMAQFAQSSTHPAFGVIASSFTACIAT
jgi:hypothetical protein